MLTKHKQQTNMYQWLSSKFITIADTVAQQISLSSKLGGILSRAMCAVTLSESDTY